MHLMLLDTVAKKIADQYLIVVKVKENQRMVLNGDFVI